MSQLCTFLLAGRHFGVPVEAVQEVLRPQPTTRVPLAPKGVTGLVNLRGQILTAIDLRARLDLPPGTTVPLNVVVRTAEGLKSLLVDDVGDVIAVDEATFEPATDLLTGPARALLRGAYKLDGRLLLLLDVTAAVNTKASVGA